MVGGVEITQSQRYFLKPRKAKISACMCSIEEEEEEEEEEVEVEVEGEEEEEEKDRNFVPWPIERTVRESSSEL